MLTFQTFILWLHITAIVLWVGGLFAVPFVLIPVLRKAGQSPQEAARLVTTAVQRFQRISRELITIVLLTGIFNLMNSGMVRGFSFSGAYISILAIKTGFFVAIIAIQLWQSYRLAPAFVAATSEDSPTKAIQRLQRRASLTSLIQVILAASAILLGLKLRYV